MGRLVAALPMYDWPELRADNDQFWARLRDHLRGRGIDAPDALVRRNADLPPVPGGIRDASGALRAPDPASLDPEGLDLHSLWLHPDLLFGQTCWGPMETGFADQVSIIGQPDYSGIEGGSGAFYSSAIILWANHPAAPPDDVRAPLDGQALVPADILKGLRFVYNDPLSRSGFKGLQADLLALAGDDSLVRAGRESGGHRQSVRMVGEGLADCAAIDCLSWAYAKLHEPAAQKVRVVGWTARRLGLPFIQSPSSRKLAKDRDAWRDAPLHLAMS